MGVVSMLYDLVEAECVKQETKVFNLEPHQKDQIIAEYMLGKAFWQVFVGLQRRIQTEITAHLGTQVDGEEMSDEQREQAALLNATVMTE